MSDTTCPDCLRWRQAALLKDRTRRAIRERLRLGEPSAEIQDDLGIAVPDAFMRHLAEWQLFEDTDEAME